MNRDRAETFLRLVTEARLRQLTAHPPDQAPLPDMPGAGSDAAGLLARPGAAALLGILDDPQRGAITRQYYEGLSEAETATAMGISRGAVRAHTARGISTLRAELETEYRVPIIAQALTAVGALDAQVAAQILDEFRQALAARGAGSGGQRVQRPMGLAQWRGGPISWPGWQAHPPGPAGPQAAPGPIVPLGQMISFQGADVAGELHLLSYARLASGPQLSVFARECGEPGWWKPSGPGLFGPFTATDDRGTSYRIAIRDLDIANGPLGWTLMLYPDPPHDPAWLDLIPVPGGPAVHIDLDRRAPGTRSPDAADVTVTKTALSPGEHLLHAIAARLLAAAWPVSQDGPTPTVLTPRALTRLADGLGDIIVALQACGAMSPLSPVPGQLAAVCDVLDVDGHGITAPPARDLPEPWLSVLACHRRRKTRAAPARDGGAAVAVTLPDLDGITLTILGVHNCQDSTVVHMHASGPEYEVLCAPQELYPWAAIWVRDSGGRWHTTRIIGRIPMDGEMPMRVEVVPPLSRSTAWIELVVAGRSAEVRATLPLVWV